MRMKLFAVFGGVGLFLATAPVLAHHGAGAFDTSKPLTLKGTVTKMEWLNPHTWLHLDVKQPDGTVVNWAVEGGAPNALIRRGATKDSILPGMEVVVEGFAAKDGSPMATGAQVQFADGHALFVGGTGTSAPGK